MDLIELTKPFPLKDIAFRIQASGGSGPNRWARVLAYVDARAIQDRLDQVCGAQGWEILHRPCDVKGVIATLRIKVGDEWIQKEDGSEFTEVEPFKGGMSKALVRAASVWGIGRYLYNLGAAYADIVDQNTEGARYAKDKQGEFYWLPPQLPAWALPEGEAQTEPPIGSLINEAPKSKPASVVTLSTQAQIEVKQAHAGSDYVIPFGKFKGKKLSEVKESEIRGYIAWLAKDAADKGKAMDAKSLTLKAAVDAFYQPAAPAPVAVGLSKAVEFVKQQEAVAEPGADMDDLPL
jgi:hypothetical protein